MWLLVVYYDGGNHEETRNMERTVTEPNEEMEFLQARLKTMDVEDTCQDPLLVDERLKQLYHYTKNEINYYCCCYCYYYCYYHFLVPVGSPSRGVDVTVYV